MYSLNKRATNLLIFFLSISLLIAGRHLFYRHTDLFYRQFKIIRLSTIKRKLYYNRKTC